MVSVQCSSPPLSLELWINHLPSPLFTQVPRCSCDSRHFHRDGSVSTRGASTFTMPGIWLLKPPSGFQEDECLLQRKPCFYQDHQHKNSVFIWDGNGWLYWVTLKRFIYIYDFPGGSDGKASVYNAGDPGSISGSGRFPGEGNGNPPQYSCLENPMDREAWCPWGPKNRTRLSDFTFHKDSSRPRENYSQSHFKI